MSSVPPQILLKGSYLTVNMVLISQFLLCVAYLDVQYIA